MSIIKISNLTFEYDYKKIFENVSFNIDTDWKLGFIGRNGKGKTTFLKLLLGKLEYSGSITSSVTFEYFPFEVKNKEKYTIDIIEEISGRVENWRINKELNLIGIDNDVLYREFSTLSNGEQTKVLLLSLFLKENNFLLIDEPTNHLDSAARKIVSEYLNSKKGFILVSHDREFLDNTVDHILSINNTNIDIQKGNFSSWSKNKNKQDNFEINRNNSLIEDIERLSSSSRRTSNWSDKVEKTKIGAADKGYIGHKAAKMMKTSKVIEKRIDKAIEEKSGLIKNIDRMEELEMKPLRYVKNPIITVSNLSISYDDKSVLDNISFSINVGDRIAICGKNGTGKSSILKLIIGENIKYNGELKIGNDLKISYIQQDASRLSGNLKDFSEENDLDESIFKAMLKKLGFSNNEFEKDISALSEGQKKKILIAKSISESAHIYIWDEPLNFIDVISRIQIEESIVLNKPTMIFVEHDKTFVDNVSTKIIEL